MKFLITGAGGQLGREWQDYLQRKNRDFVAFQSSQLDITDSAKLEEAISYHRPDVIINCAAYSRVDDAENNVKEAFDVNQHGVRNLATLSKKYSIKLVHYSTDYVFAGSIEDKRRLKRGYPESHRTDPVNVYGESKLLGENEIKHSGCDYIILRVSWLCGKYGKNFVKTMVGLAHQGKFLNVVNDQWGSPTFAKDLVNTTIALLRNNRSGIFHFSSKGIISWYELAKEAIDLAGYKTSITPVPTSEYPTRAVRPEFSKLDTSKIASVPGINISFWKDSLKELITSLNS